MDNSTKDQEIKITKELIEAFDTLLGTGDWEASLFLRNASKKLKALRAETQELLDDLTGSPHEAHVKDKPHQAKSGHIFVYVSMYQTEGNDLNRWQNLLKGLPRYSLSRPIYRDEEHLCELIRSKVDAKRHGYAKVQVDTDDILVFDHAAKDQFGHEQLNLKENAIKVENIVEFVHANSERFQVKNGTLIRL